MTVTFTEPWHLPGLFRAAAIKRRKELWAQRHPDEQVAQDAPPVEVKKHGHAQAKAFAAETSERTGQSKRSINEHVSRAEALGDDLDGPPSEYPGFRVFDSSAS